MEKDIITLSVPDPGRRALKPIGNVKMTRQKRIDFLREFAKNYNITRSAAAVGVSRQAIADLAKRDPQFAAAMETVRNAYLDTAEEAMFTVALQPSRDGFNDRKLALQAHRPEIYNPKQEIDVNQTITVVASPGEIRQVLGQFGPGKQIEDARYTIIDDPAD